MPKKRTVQYAKPASVPHPSLASSSNQHASRRSGSGSNATTASVNDLIRHLRQTQVSSTLSDRPQNEPNTHTVHPSLKAILDIPDTPAPRPRSGMRVSGGRRARGPAGPPPPRSWLTRRDGAATSCSRMSGPDRGMADRHLGSLPGVSLPEKGSLQHLTLKSLAVNWEWHKEYDQYYLATLPRRHKETLLSYIASYSDRGIDAKGLNTLFLDDAELEGATGSENITHLDLGTSVGRAMSLKELKDVFTIHTRLQDITSPGRNDVPNSSERRKDVPIPDSWDEDTTLATPLTVARFPALTHLSLSHPAVGSWKALLALAPHLATLTHLSLAFWPTPSITPNSKTAYRESPAGNIDYGASNFYSASDGDLSEAAGVLKRLSRATYCLQWLDLTGCSDWIQALGREDGPDWFGAWRGVETIKVGQGWIPETLLSGSNKWRRLFKRINENWVSDRSEDENIALRKELIAWVNVEDSISAAEAGVDMMLKYARRSSAAGKEHSSRTGRVRFERGWQGWWIEDALKQISQREFWVNHLR